MIRRPPRSTRTDTLLPYTTLFRSREAGLLFEGDRRFAVVVRLPDAQRDDIDTLGSIPVMLPSNGAGNARSIPLSEVARFTYTEGLNQISRENGKRMVVIQANVRGRDLGGFVAEAQTKIADVKLPAGTFTEWGGQVEGLQSASEPLARSGARRVGKAG